MGRTLRRPRRSTLIIEITETWNLEFFVKRGVEAILYKGRERRTGDVAKGTISEEEEEEDEDDSESSDDDTDMSERDYLARGRYSYNPGEKWREEGGARNVLDRFRTRREQRRTKRLHRDKQERRREKEREARERPWSLHFRAIPPRSPRYHGRSIV